MAKRPENTQRAVAVKRESSVEDANGESNCSTVKGFAVQCRVEVDPLY